MLFSKKLGIDIWNIIGHGCFRSNLKKYKIVGNEISEFYSSDINDAKHMLFDSAAFESNRVDVNNRLGDKLFHENLVIWHCWIMLLSKDKLSMIEEHISDIMKHKQQKFTNLYSN